MLTLCFMYRGVSMKKINLLALAFVVVNFSSIVAKNYKGAEYRTKETFLYGRFESSFKTCGKEGALSTMFTYFDGTDEDPWASYKWNEIDVEVLGRYNNDVQFNTITSGATNHVRHNLVNFNPALDYHTYAFEWTPDYIAWFIDGIEVYRQTEEFVKTVTRTQKLMFNMWLPNYPNWIGVFNEQILPAFTLYNWASYYSYTPGKGNYGTNNNFTFSWKDDFDSFDPNRWEKATHTWDGNNCDMLPGNINFKDGKMIMSLTKSSETGAEDRKAPVVISARALNETKVLVYFSEEVDNLTAESADKYILAGFTPTKKAALLSDNRTVELDVDQLNLSSLPNLIVLGGIKDRANPVNISSNLAVSLIPTLQFKFPLKINVGGNEYNSFLPDREFKTDTASYGYMEGSKISTNADIANTNDDPVYQTGIINLAKYVVRIPNGKYKVRLLFSENSFSNIDLRVFDVYVQGKHVLKAMDLVRQVGPQTAYEKVVDEVVVANYMLEVHFAALINNAVFNGIIIEQLGSGIEEHSSIPNSIQLEQNYPNPFNPDTTISYKIQSTVNVSLKVYDILGNEIATLVNESKQPGTYHSTFSTDKIKKWNYNSQLTSGIYFYTLLAGAFIDTKKMVFVK
jgi:hypothetical protein